MSSFWDAEGLRRVAELIRMEMEMGKVTQKEIAQRAQVSEQTISNLLLNRYNADGKIVKPPHPDTILKVAPHITDPAKKEPFDPEELLLIARGKAVPLLADSEPLECDRHPYPAAVEELRRLMGDRTIEQAAQDWGISPARLHGFLTATDERAVPNLLEVKAIVVANYPDKLINRFYQFYEEPQTVNQINGGKKRSR